MEQYQSYLGHLLNANPLFIFFKFVFWSLPTPKTNIFSLFKELCCYLNFYIFQNDNITYFHDDFDANSNFSKFEKEVFCCEWRIESTQHYTRGERDEGGEQ